MTDKDWYSPGEIRITVRQALWLIQNLGSLREGHWPPEASSYINMPGTEGGRHRAPFTTPVEYAAEIESRLEKCVVDRIPDGLILESIECFGKSLESLATYFEMEVWSILKRRSKALSYVASGPSRRWHKTKKRAPVSYQDFKRRKR